MQDSLTLAQSLRATGRWRRALYLAGFAATLLAAYATRAPMLTDWDSWEYAAQAVHCRVSGLCLGRWWFALLMHLSCQVGLWVGLPLSHNFQALRVTVALCTAGAVVGAMHWTYLLSRRLLASVLAGVMLIVSGSLMAYASAVMNEGPTLLFLVLALLGWEAALRRSGARGCDPQSADARSPRAAAAMAILAGAAFGIAANMREPALMLCFWPVVSCFVDRPVHRWRLLALAAIATVLTFGFGAAMTWFQRGEPLLELLAGYSKYMAQERATYGWDKSGNVAFLAIHLHAAVPLATTMFVVFLVYLPMALARKCKHLRQVPGRRLAALFASTIPYLLMTWYNPDLHFNYRLMLPMGLIFAPIAAICVAAMLSDVVDGARRRAAGFVGAAAMTLATVGAIAVSLVTCNELLSRHLNYSRWQAVIFQGIEQLDDGTCVLGGPGAPMVEYLRELKFRPRMEKMIPGFEATPDLMTERFDQRLAKGKRVFVYCKPNNWASPGRSKEYDATQAAVKRFPRRSGPPVRWGGGTVRPFVELLPRTDSSKAANE